MAEVNPFKSIDPHTDEHEGEEHETGFGEHDNTGFNPDDHDVEKEERVKQAAIDEIKSKGFKAPTDLYYKYMRQGVDTFFVVSEDKVNWYKIDFGFAKGEAGISLVPEQGKQRAPDRLYAKFGIELPHEGEMTKGPVEYLHRVFDNPDLSELSYGISADDRVWVALHRTNAVKYYVREDGTAETLIGKEIDLPKTVKPKLGKTCVVAMAEREGKIRVNREKEEYLAKIQNMEQNNIELRERNEDVETMREAANKESSEKDDLIASLEEKIQKDESYFEQLGVDMARLKEKEEYYKEEIKDLKEKLEGTLSSNEKARITAELQMMSRENQTNIENVNEKQTQLNQAARDIAQQKERIGELEMQREELEARIIELEREVERNIAQVERNESEIGDQNLQEVEQERIELERENEQLEERNEEAFAKLSLKEKVKYIFSKYGVTVVGVLAAVGTIIGVIVSNLKAGLTKVANGVGNDLKEIGKKLGQILPGMVGAIVSFLFKTAGEAVGFLAKNSWLLILLVVTFAIEGRREVKNEDTPIF